MQGMDSMNIWWLIVDIYNCCMNVPNNNNNNNNNSDRHFVQMEAEKKLKYKSLYIEIQRMWNLKYTIIPGIIGATGIVRRRLRKNLEAMPERHSIDLLQKTAILGTSHKIWKELQCESWSLSGGDHRWFKRSTRQKRPVTREKHIVWWWRWWWWW